MKQPNRTILCMKWGTLYSAEYVNILYSACLANMDDKFNFICLTNEPEGISNQVKTLPIPEIGCTQEMWQNGAWPKLCVFQENLYGLRGRCLFIDLDMIICGSLSHFFDHPAPFIAIDTGPDWKPNRETGGERAQVGTGIFAFNLGAEAQILNQFMADPSKAYEECKIEQVWVAHQVSSIAYWPKDWVISFKRWLRRPIGLDLFLSPRKPPAGTSVVAFHGNPRPSMLVENSGKRWDTWPHMGRGQVKWMQDYWQTHGRKS